MEIKRHLTRTYKWEYFWLCLIVLSTLVMHLAILDNVKELILDEQHYIKDARYIFANHSSERTENPPLSKLLIMAGDYIFSGFRSPVKYTGTTTQQAVTGSTSPVISVSDSSLFKVGQTIEIDNEWMVVRGIDTTLQQLTVERGNTGTTATSHAALQKIYVFIDNPWGWRVFPVLFGTTSIVLFYFLCRKLFMSRETSSIATFLLAFENMTFLQASVAMEDVFFFTFMIGAFLLYVNRKYISSGIAIGLSALAKLTGALTGPVIFIYWIFTRRRRSWWFLLTPFFAIIAFVELMIPLDYAISRNFTSMADPINRIKTMLSMTGSLTFANVDHPSKSRPWEWLISWKPMAYYIMPHYTAAISFTIFALAIPAFGYLVYKAIKKNEAGLFGLAWFSGTFMVMVLLSIITDRVSYIFYFYPVIGAICIGVALFLGDLLVFFRNRKHGKLKWTAFSVVIFILFAHLVSFCILSPLIPVDFYAIYNNIVAKITGFIGSW